MQEMGFTNNDALGNPGDDTSHPVTVERAAVNIFFDGTLNNYANASTKQKLEGQDSYKNALTNVAKMWSNLDLDPVIMAVYIQGIGTTQGQPDSTMGYALGMGETGVQNRVQGAFAKVVKKVKDVRGDDGIPAILDINVFGFSRGAAAARYFVHLVNTEPKRFHLQPGWAKVMIRIHFVGLFDTVASYGVNHSNDVGELHLNFGPGYAHKVFHLVAGDEYRLNFPLTTIASASNHHVSTPEGGHPMGYELRIPGAHSDVGGGYHPIEKERRQLNFELQDFVYEQGWYSPKSLKDRWTQTHERQVQGEYVKVALALMVDQAHKHSTVQFPPDLLDPPADKDIQTLRETLRAFAKDEKNTDWDVAKQLGTDKAQALRHQWLHMSFRPGTFAYAPRLAASGQPSRELLQG